MRSTALFLEELQYKPLFLIDETRSISAKEFVERIETKAQQLPAQKGRVYFPIERSIDSLEWLFAFLLKEFLVFIGNPTAPTGKISALMDYIQPHFAAIPSFQLSALPPPISTKPLTSALLLCELPKTEEILDPIETSAQIALMTSGTTGEPKAILHRFSNLLHNASLHADAIELTPQDCVAVALPLHFSYGLVAVILGALVCGASLQFTSISLPEELGSSLSRSTIFSATPLFARRMTHIPFRTLTIGGDLTTAPLAAHFLKQNPGLHLFTTYGLTEAGPRVFTQRIGLEHVQYDHLPMGIPLSNVQWTIAEDQELCVTTPTAMLGYYRRPKETAETLFGTTLYTGDLVKWENDHLYFLGRKKRLICRGGEKIYPSEIERVVQQIPFIRNAYVALSENETLVAYLETEHPINSKEIKNILARHFPRSQFPDRFEIVSTLPAAARKK